MQSLQNPSHTSLAVGAFVAVWMEVATKRATFRDGIIDTFDLVMQLRRAVAEAAPEAPEAAPKAGKRQSGPMSWEEATATQEAYQRARASSSAWFDAAP